MFLSSVGRHFSKDIAIFLTVVVATLAKDSPTFLEVVVATLEKNPPTFLAAAAAPDNPTKHLLLGGNMIECPPLIRGKYVSLEPLSMNLQ